MKHKSSHKKFMKKALRLAAKGVFTTGANPRVGCVIVKDNQILAQAYHQRVGEKHAEALALAKAGESAQGATAYVTLEPCSHVGKNPPCADALIHAGIKTVVVCNDDPNPLVAGQGYQKLELAGITVIRGVLSERGQDLNRGFLHRMQTGMPWIRSKSAQSLDGRTAMASGESYWITGEKARADVQYWRGRSGAVITGIETVLQDDCQLNFRPEKLSKKHQEISGKHAVNQPLRVIVDSHLRTPLDARILNHPTQVLIATAVEDEVKKNQYIKSGIQVKTMRTANGQVDLQQLCRYLAMHEINEVLIESGATLSGAFLAAGLIDEIIVYTAPILLGSSGRPLFQINIEEMSKRHHIEITSIKSFDKDQRLRAMIQQ
jgi:diaminohydroxyphosphoribosylaminopyrimidine deaminase/5-amino-6-(5-phosphoribosylamino)uracil reductase